MKYIKLFENFEDSIIKIINWEDANIAIPKNLNILDTDYYSEWKSLVDEFDENGDYDEYKYEPTDEFILFLSSKKYNGFMNGDNILIFNKSLLK